MPVSGSFTCLSDRLDDFIQELAISRATRASVASGFFTRWERKASWLDHKPLKNRDFSVAIPTGTKVALLALSEV
jgi:hypothetical protein